MNGNRIVCLIAVVGALLLAAGVTLVRLVGLVRSARASRDHWQGRARAHVDVGDRWCPLCGFTFVGDDIMRRAFGTDGATIIHADDCGPGPGRVKLALPTHDMTDHGTLTRRAP